MDNNKHTLIYLKADKAELRVSIVGHQYPDASPETLDAEWLLFQVDVDAPEGRWTRVDPAELAPRILDLPDWFLGHAEGKPGVRDVYLFDELMFGNNDDGASLAVSDHRPVSVIFRTDLPDDDGEGTYHRMPEPVRRPEAEDTAQMRRTGDIRFARVIAHPTDEESITLRNQSQHPIDISGWVMGDKNDPNAYRFPAKRSIGAGAELTIPRTTFGFAINNSGEVLYLRDASRELIDTWSNDATAPGGQK